MCDFKFDSSERLNRHIGAKHGSKKFSCDKCHFRADNKEILSKHKKIHNKQPDFWCKVCSRKW